MRYCVECLQPDTRPNTIFNQEGICPACEFSKKNSDNPWKKQKWDLSIRAFKDYIQRHLVDQEGYNCCLGVSGGKDSTRQTLFAGSIRVESQISLPIFPPELMTVTGANNLGIYQTLAFKSNGFGWAQ